MMRLYNKTELLDCAAQLPHGAADIKGKMEWALNNVSLIVEDNAADLFRWTKYFMRQGVKPTIQISNETLKSLEKLYSQYKVSQSTFFSEEEVRSVRAEQLVAMMEKMRNQA